VPVLLLRPRPSLLHCSFCRDQVTRSEETACAECGVLLHAECWPELRRCPTPGCTCTPRHRVSLFRRPRRVERAPRLPWPARLLVRLGGLIAASVVLGIGITLAFELLGRHAWSWAGFLIQAPFVGFAIWLHSWFRELASAPQAEPPNVVRGRYLRRRAAR